MAFIKQCRFRLPLAWCENYRSLEPADDFVWAHRSVIHCADVLMYCYGERRDAMAEYNLLLEYHRGWTQLRPSSFEPIFEMPSFNSESAFYPEVWYLSDCHVTGVQHLELAKILLTAHSPLIPRFGPSQKLALERIESEIAGIVRHICGIALSNNRAPPAIISAGMAISMCGEQFSNPREQQAMLDLLSETETEYAWPTQQIQDKLKMSWGWY